MAFLFVKRLEEATAMDRSELLLKLKSTNPVFADFHEVVVAPALNFWRSKILPVIYKRTEKAISRFRINILKIESNLLRLTNYIRGKRKVCSNGDSSPYWKDMNDFKKDLNGNGNGGDKK